MKLGTIPFIFFAVMPLVGFCNAESFNLNMDNILDLIQNNQQIEAVFHVSAILNNKNLPNSEKIRYLHTRAVLALQTNNRDVFEKDYISILDLCENFSECYAIYLNLAPSLDKYYYICDE